MNLEEITNKIKNTEKYIDGWKTMKRASVAILLTEINGIPNIIFEVRGKNLREQPGDICFPGGKIDKDETPKEAVIREIEEELGLSFKNVEIIKELDTLIRYNGLIVHPFFGMVKDLSEIKLSENTTKHINEAVLNTDFIFNDGVKIVTGDIFSTLMHYNGAYYNLATSPYYLEQNHTDILNFLHNNNI